MGGQRVEEEVWELAGNLLCGRVALYQYPVFVKTWVTDRSMEDGDSLVKLMLYYFMFSSVSLSMPLWKNWESHSKIRKS